MGKKVLVSIPHETLLRREGHLTRLLALLTVMNDVEYGFVIPDTVPETDREVLGTARYWMFRETRFLGRAFPYLCGWNFSFRRAWEQAVGEFQPDLVVGDFPWGMDWFGPRSTVPVLHISHGVEQDFSRVTLDHLGLSCMPSRWIARSCIGAIERSALRGSHLIVCMSEHDKERLSTLYAPLKGKFLAVPQPQPQMKPSLSKETIRERLQIPLEAKVCVFHGSYHHFPNRRAVELLKEEILPRVCQSVPEMFLLLVGTGMTASVSPRCYTLPFVENLADVLSAADLAVLPILDGSGVRMKSYDYVALGIPLVATKKALEGSSLNNSECAFLSEDSVSSFCQVLNAALGDLVEARKKALNASRRLAEEGDQAHWADEYLKQVRQLGSKKSAM